MAEKSSIEWTDATWNPITGCSIVSPGCRRCYAMKLAGTRLRNHPSRIGLTVDTKEGAVWSGEVRFNEGWLNQPLRWHKARDIFVCAHSDLFHPGVPDEWIDQIFAVMALAPQHTFQVLTKRPWRMNEYLLQSTSPGRQWSQIGDIGYRARKSTSEIKAAMDMVGSPFPNVWLGTSIERQKEADERVPALLSTPAAVRFVSAEPLLGPLDMKGRGWLPPDLSRKAGRLEPPYLDWVIVGGESATDAKPMNPAWVRSLRDQCAGSVPFLFKQWGSWRPNFGLKNHHARVWPDGSWSHNVGKGVAGRLLDGREHNGMPARWAEA